MQRDFSIFCSNGRIWWMVTIALVASVTLVPAVMASKIQVGADGRYVPPASEAAETTGPAETEEKPAPSAAVATTVPKDLVFVIDNSGSMKKNDPDFTTKRVVARFWEQLAAHDRCAIVIFDSKARQVTPLLEMGAADSLPQLSDGLGAVNYRGQRTDSPAGIERAIYELRTTGREDAVKSIIFLTDGIVDTGSAQSDADKTRWLREDLTAESRKADIRIFGIAFTENADFQLIQSLAMKTDGAYYRALDAAGMEAAFDAVSAQLRTLSEIPPAAEPTATSASAPQPATAPIQSLPSLDDPPAAPAAAPEAKTPAPAVAGKAPGAASGAIALRGMWKIYLPLFIIALLLISVLTYMILRLRGARGPVTSRILDILPDGKADGAANVKVPEAQLIDLDQACASSEGPLLIEKMQTTIGRDSRNDVVIDQPTISGFHACITFERDRFELEDYRSTNGSFVNGLRLEADIPKHLKTGDCIKFADFEFRFMRLDRIPDDQTVMLSSSALPAATYAAPPPEAPLPAEEMGGHFKTVLGRQLEQIADLGAPFARFVQDHLDPFTQNLLSAKVSSHLDEDGTGAFFASDVLHRPPIAFKLCQLPVPPQAASAWFEEAHGGFLSFLEEILDKEVQQQPGCDTLCLISYGWEKTPWVSISIVPAEDGDHPVEIMSVEFLTQKELDMLGLEFDENGRIISGGTTITRIGA
ncbi:MAG: VWA domain-containing protein [Desulfosarcinaceae bacterium]|nr:VWA domain-containing protein [Desulfosarcinaceae bacterium]